jgi:hypothetical protein
MKHFWTKDGPEPHGLHVHRHYYSAGLAATGRRIAGQQSPAYEKDALFRARDWAGVTQLLEPFPQNWDIRLAVMGDFSPP